MFCYCFKYQKGARLSLLSFAYDIRCMRKYTPAIRFLARLPPLCLCLCMSCLFLPITWKYISLNYLPFFTTCISPASHRMTIGLSQSRVRTLSFHGYPPSLTQGLTCDRKLVFSSLRWGMIQLYYTSCLMYVCYLETASPGCEVQCAVPLLFYYPRCSGLLSSRFCICGKVKIGAKFPMWLIQEQTMHAKNVEYRTQ